MCESGHHVPFTDDLIEFLSHIVPESNYILSSFIDVPRFPTDPRYFFKKFQRDLKIGIDFNNLYDVISLPGIHRGTYSWDSEKIENGWFFQNLQVVAIPLHSVWDQERVEYFKRRMMENNNQSRNFKGDQFDSEKIDVFSTLQSHMHLKEYIPTAIVLSPESGQHFYALAGLVLDGHHKIQAAAETGSPIRVILIEHSPDRGCRSFMRYDYSRFGVCYCTYCLTKGKGVPLSWACQKDKCAKEWKEEQKKYKEGQKERRTRNWSKKNSERFNEEDEQLSIYEGFIEDEREKYYLSKLERIPKLKRRFSSLFPLYI
jgi:hypothetical protein